MVKTAMLLADGFEEIEALTVVDVLRRAGAICDMTSLVGEKVKGCHGMEVSVDKTLDEIGGLPGATNLRDDERVISLVQKFDADESKFVAAICAAPMVFAKAGIAKGRHVTSYPGFEDLFGDAFYENDIVVVDGKMITARGPATAMAFSYAIVDALGLNSNELKDGMLYTMLLDQCK